MIRLKKKIFLVIIVSAFFLHKNVLAQQDETHQKLVTAFTEAGIEQERIDQLITLLPEMNIYDIDAFIDYHIENQKRIDTLLNNKESISTTEGVQNQKYYQTIKELIYANTITDIKTLSKKTPEIIDQINNYYNELERIKFRVIEKYGLNHSKYYQINQFIQELSSYSDNFNYTRTLPKEDIFSKLLSDEFLKRDGSVIAEEVDKSLLFMDNENLSSSFILDQLYDEKYSIQGEIRSRLGISETPSIDKTIQLIETAFIDNEREENVNESSFYKMLQILEKKLVLKIQKNESLLITKEEFIAENYNLNDLESGNNQLFSKEQRLEMIYEQAEQMVTNHNMTVHFEYNIIGLKEFIQDIRALLRNKTNLINDYERFKSSYIWLFTHKSLYSEDRLEYAKQLKYKPRLLLRFIEKLFLLDSTITSKQSQELSIPKLNETEREIFLIIKNNYIKAFNFYDSNTKIKKNDSVFRGEIRNILLNIALDLHKEGYNLFKDQQNQRKDRINKFIDLDDILDLKGGEFKTKDYIVNGVRNSGSEPLIEYYNRLKNKKAELRSLILFSEKKLSKKRLTKQAIQDSLVLIQNKENEFLLLLQSYIDLESHYKDKVIEWLGLSLLLEKNEAFVDFQRIEILNQNNKISYLVTVITKSSRKIFILDNGFELENKYYNQYKSKTTSKLNKADYDRGIGSLTGSSNSSEEDLAEIYWSRFTKEFSGIKRFFISNDGIYHKINLESLKDRDDDSFLIDKFEIISLYDILDFKILKNSGAASKASNQNFELFGRPAYYLTDSTNSSSALTFVSDSSKRAFSENSVITDLEGTEIEVRKIKEILSATNNSVNTYLFEEASETKIKSSEFSGTLHLATHGFFNEEYRQITNSSGYFNLEKEYVLNNPFLKSGLLFSGAGNSLGGVRTSTDDGILTGEEIVHLKLLRTNLVVLSACETGSGDFMNGEGIIGLQRAFLIAGAKSVIMTLWEVDDIATQKLMTMFYTNWISKGMNKREALRNAKLELKDSYSAPYYWAAFVYLGD